MRHSFIGSATENSIDRPSFPLSLPSAPTRHPHRGCRRRSGVRTAIALVLALAGGLPIVGRAADDAALARERKCMNCHAVDQKLVGPAFNSVAARYAGDPAAEERLARKIREGGAGAWGVVPMPANGEVTPDEAKRLAHWVLMQK